MKHRGFSLVEVLVVVAIVALLSAMAISAIDQAGQDARDARRIADINSIALAMDQYFIDRGRYVSEQAYDTSRGSGASLSSVSPGTDWGSPVTQLESGGYISDLPIDPLNSTQYYYSNEPLNSGPTYNIGENDNYCLVARLESIRGAIYVNKDGARQVNPEGIFYYDDGSLSGRVGFYKEGDFAGARYQWTESAALLGICQ